MPKQQRAHLGERQHTDHRSVLQRQHRAIAMAEHLGDQAGPGGAMEERRLRPAGDERLPGRRVRGVERHQPDHLLASSE
jgi:hypothetical protein